MAEALFTAAAEGATRPAPPARRRRRTSILRSWQPGASWGVDLESRVPHALDRTDAQWADVIVTMGCGDACPYVPGKRYVDWELQDPAGLPPEEVRRIRDEISERTLALLVEFDP
jgi:arsenate reductase